jgi:tRNA pseudouridine32 synthase/23S rRNA pseudouridine746 synthase
MSRSTRHPLITPRDGVAASCVALPTLAAGAPLPWPGLLDFLDHRLPHVGRSVWAARLAAGEVFGEDGQPLPTGAPYRPGSRVYYYRAIEAEQPIPFTETLRFVDDHLVVVDKPHFLPVMPAGRYLQETLLVRLKQRLGLDTLAPIHRIDRETAGLVLFAVRVQDRAAYQSLFRDRQVHKVYEAIAPWHEGLDFPLQRRSRIVEDPAGFYRMAEAEGEPNSETSIDLIERRGGSARYRLEPLTGKRHQLRVHMNALGLPLLGDQFYPVARRGRDEEEDFSEPLRLLAQSITFTDPVTGEARHFDSGLTLLW